MIRCSLQYEHYQQCMGQACTNPCEKVSTYMHKNLHFHTYGTSKIRNPFVLFMVQYDLKNLIPLYF